MLISRKTFTPRPYGSLITRHALDTPRGAVWAGMGMGKTVSTLNALSREYRAGDDRPTLVLAPLRVAESTWPDEVAKWAHLSHLDIVPVVGSVKERVRALQHDVPIYTINYENVPWLVEHFGARWPFRRVVADESTKLKGFRLRQGGARARALGSVAHQHIKQFIELTGTPSPNGLKDLWGQAWFLDAGMRLGRTYSAFRDRWFRPAYDGFDVEPLPFAQEQITEALHDLCLSLDPKDWFDLHEPIVRPKEVNLPLRARGIYRDMERKMFAEISEQGVTVEAFNAAARSSKCLQIASGSVWTDAAAGAWSEIHDVKLQALDEIVEEAAGMPVLVRYHWIPSRERILRAFPKARHLDKNPTTIREWNKGKIPMLVAHAASCGHGLNLQDGGNILANFDQWWDLEHAMQILERIGPVRQLQAGYNRPVWIYNIVAKDTIDEDVAMRIATKRSVQDILLDAMKRRG